MRRTKKTKKQETMLAQMPHGQFGGCMPNPPKDCKERREFQDKNGVEYINNVICTECRDGCSRRKEFKHEWKVYWKMYRQIQNGTNGQDLVVPNGLD